MRCMGCGASMRLTEEPFEEEFQREKFAITGVEHYACDKCGEIELNAEGMAQCQKIAHKEYRERHGLLTPGEIRATRKALGLSQKEFEAMLGVSSPTVSRWETGSVIQTKPIDNLIRGVADHEGLARDLMAKSEVRREATIPARACKTWTTGLTKKGFGQWENSTS